MKDSKLYYILSIKYKKCFGCVGKIGVTFDIICNIFLKWIQNTYYKLTDSKNRVFESIYSWCHQYFYKKEVTKYLD